MYIYVYMYIYIYVYIHTHHAPKATIRRQNLKPKLVLTREWFLVFCKQGGPRDERHAPAAKRRERICPSKSRQLVYHEAALMA